jgi:hypothetical protein
MTTRRHPVTRKDARYHRHLRRLPIPDRQRVEEYRTGYRHGMRDALYYIKHGRWPRRRS